MHHDTTPRSVSSRDIARASMDPQLRGQDFAPRRSAWPGLLAVTVIAAAMGALFVSSFESHQRQGPAVEAPRTASSDLSITETVRSAFAAEPPLAALNIDVSTRDGAVTLIGTAPNEATRDRAEAIASASLGVRHVDNQLVLATTAARG